MFRRLRETAGEIVKSRLIILAVVFCVLFFILIYRCFYLQIIKGQDYLDNYRLQIQKTKEIPGTRGNIYDKNGKLLAYNDLAYAVTIEDNGSYDTKMEKNDTINETLNKVMDIIEKHEDTVVNNFGIVIDSDDEYAFSSEKGTTRNRFLADIYGYKTIDEMSAQEKSSTPNDVMNHMCESYGITQKDYSKSRVLQLVTIRYAMAQNSFQKYIATTIATDVSDATVAEIEENIGEFQGVNINEDSIRRYVDSEYFASIIGYTGQISEAEYDDFTEKGLEYSLTDIVGKAGIEQAMDQYLQGEKGSETVYVDSTGKVIEVKDHKDATAGNDLYLSMDKDLQEAAYHLLEQKLAGILLQKIQDVYNFEATGENDIIIGIDDVYNAFFENHVLDTSHFSEDDAGTNEKKVYKKYEARQKEVLDEITDELTAKSPAAYGDLEKEMREYMYYIYDTVLTDQTGIIMEENIDSDNEMYQKLVNERSISMKEFLTYAISQNWIDTAKLQEYIDTDEIYTDSSQIYDGIISFLKDYLPDNTGFGKIIYKYMIKSKKISGEQICLLLYEQNVLTDKEGLAELKSGASAYSFIRKKIENLEITPAQLALEPCSASAVITDPNSGKVLALVSYPGYDNNRLANNMDSEYYSLLLNDGSKPLFNKATQEETAPGSTFKMISAVTALTEGIVNAGTYFSCTGTYTKIEPNPHCWIYPGSHGSLNVVGAIQHSCNCYFYEVGYELGLTEQQVKEENGTVKTEKVYSSEKGLETLAKYASEFGLDSTTGLEITEAEPKISDNSAVHSAIGQGTNNYTTANLSRYVAAVANEGTVYDLSLVDCVKDKNGKTVKEFKSKVHNQIDNVSQSTWSLVKEGMRNMILNSYQFRDLNSTGFAVAGKTGTAQQSAKHPDHALFVGFAPYDNPEISIAVRITNGYKSAYATEAAQDILEYEFQLKDTKDLITGKASMTGSQTSGD